MRTMQNVFMTLSVLCLAVPAFAQASGGDSSHASMVAIAAGLCGLGEGYAVGSSSLAIARNPGARPAIFLFLVLGLAFIESLALFTFAIIFIKVK